MNQYLIYPYIEILSEQYITLLESIVSDPNAKLSALTSYKSKIKANLII